MAGSEQSWRTQLLALDLETTGLKSGQGDRVIEVGLAWMEGEQLQVWSRLLNPGRHIRSTGIHGIADQDVSQAPRFSAIAQELADFLHQRVVVLHNAKADMAFLRLEFSRAGLALPSMEVLDTFALSRHIEGLTSRSLISLCAHYQIPLPNHRAGEDARATLQLCQTLLDTLDPTQQASLPEILQLSQKSTASVSAAAERSKLRAALETAMKQNLPLEVRYQSINEITTRIIHVRQINNREVQAYCELRQAERVFRLDRLVVVPPSEPDDQSS